MGPSAGVESNAESSSPWHCHCTDCVSNDRILAEQDNVWRTESGIAGQTEI